MAAQYGFFTAMGWQGPLLISAWGPLVPLWLYYCCGALSYGFITAMGSLYGFITAMRAIYGFITAVRAIYGFITGMGAIYEFFTAIRRPHISFHWGPKISLGGPVYVY